jgi:hypothetical protein
MFAGTEKITFPSRYIEEVAGKSPSHDADFLAKWLRE